MPTNQGFSMEKFKKKQKKIFTKPNSTSRIILRKYL
jgi:hypothetical protein